VTSWPVVEQVHRRAGAAQGGGRRGADSGPPVGLAFTRPRCARLRGTGHGKKGAAPVVARGRIARQVMLAGRAFSCRQHVAAAVVIPLLPSHAGQRVGEGVSSAFPGAPRCGVLRVMVSRTSRVQGRASSVPPARCSALRATSPPIGCPMRMRSCTGTGQASISPSSRSASRRPLSEMQAGVVAEEQGREAEVLLEHRRVGDARPAVVARMRPGRTWTGRPTSWSSPASSGSTSRWTRTRWPRRSLSAWCRPFLASRSGWSSRRSRSRSSGRAGPTWRVSTSVPTCAASSSGPPVVTPSCTPTSARRPIARCTNGRSVSAQRDRHVASTQRPSEDEPPAARRNRPRSRSVGAQPPVQSNSTGTASSHPTAAVRPQCGQVSQVIRSLAMSLPGGM
jgi:hypothetical protein